MARTTDADARAASAAPAASSAVPSPSNADLAASVAQLKREVRLLGAAVIVLGTFLLLDVRVIDGSRAGPTSPSASSARAPGTPQAPPRPLGNPQQAQIEHTAASSSGQAPPPSAAVAGVQHRIDDDAPPAPAIVSNVPTSAAPPLGLDWLPPLPESTCPKPNGPNKNFAFWKSLPQYPKFLTHHDKMVEKRSVVPSGDVALKIDVEFAEWVLLEHWQRAGVFNRVKEVFFECHSLYRLGGETIFPKPPALNGFLRDLYERLVGVLDCYLAHDLMRAEGVVTHNWP